MARRSVSALLLCGAACIVLSSCSPRQLNIGKEEAPLPMVSQQWKEQNEWLEHQQDGDFFLYIQRFDRAEQSFKTAIKKAEDARFRDARLARSQTGLARAYLNRHEFDDALRLYTKALEIKKKAYGENHYDVADILTERAYANLALFHTEDARSDVQQAKLIYRNLKSQSLPELDFVDAALDVQSGNDRDAETKFKSALQLLLSQIKLHRYPQPTKSMRIARDCGDRYISILEAHGKKSEADSCRQNLKPISEWLIILGETGV